MSNTSTSTSPSDSATSITQQIPPPLQRRPLIPTTSTSFSYVQRCASSNQIASLNDPLTTLFQAEKLPPLPNEPPLSAPPNHTSRAACDILWNRLKQLSPAEIETMIYDASVGRIRAKCELDGAFIAEAGGFAAVTCWDPLHAPVPPPDWEEIEWDLQAVLDHGNLMSNEVPMETIRKERPVFAEFWLAMEVIKYRHVYPLVWRYAQAKRRAVTLSNTNGAYGTVAVTGGTDLDIDKEHLKFWYMCLTSRNPAVQPPVPGAVRAVIEPFSKKFVEGDDIPVLFLCAGSPRSRDVYQYLGWRVVEKIVVGTDRNGDSITTWCMIYTKDQKNV